MSAGDHRSHPAAGIGHDTARVLAATALDFRLAPAERWALEAHLEACPTCCRFAKALLADAAALTGLQEVDAPPRVREQVIRECSRRGSTHALLSVALAVLLMMALVELVLGMEASIPPSSAGVGPSAAATVTSPTATIHPHGIRAGTGPAVLEGPSVP